MIKRNILLSIIAVATVLLLGSTNAWSATITSAGSGNWNVATTWIGGVVPTATDDVVIASGHTVTLAGTPTCNNLTVNGTLALSTVNFTLNGNLTVNSGGAITTGANIFTIAGTNSTLTFNSGSTVAFSGITVASTASNAKIAGNYSMSGTLNITAGGRLTHTSGTLTTATGFAITNGGTIDDLVFYNLTLGANLAGTSSYTIAGNLNSGTNNFVPTGGTVKFKNTATPNNAKTITLTGTSNFFNLQIDDGSYVTTSSSFSITGGTFEVVGSGSFKATGSSAINFSTTSATITTSSLSTCEFVSITITGATISLTTSSDFTIKGSITAPASGTGAFTANPPSTITFAGTGTSNITSNDDNDFNFNNIVVKNGKTIQTINDKRVNISGDLTIENGASADFSAAGSPATALTFTTSSTKTITNNGTLTFGFVTIAAGIVQTSSDFTIINGTLTTTSTFIASGNSTITFNTSAPLASTSQTNTIFQNIRFITTAATINSQNYRVNGDYIADANVTHGTAGEVIFQGTSQQKIKGSGTLTFYDIEVNNPYGIKLERNVICAGAATVITFNQGDIDLNGNTLTLSNAAPVIAGETSTRRFINTASNPGIVTTISITIANANASGIGTTGITGPTNVTVARILSARKIGDINSVKRYYSIIPTLANLTAVNFAYFNDELNGNTDSKLWAYATTATDANATVIGSTLTSQWVQQPSIVTTGASSGTVAITGTFAFGNTYYFAFRNREVKLESWPTTGVHNDLAVKSMPLVAGSTTTAGDNNVTNDIILARFAITPYFTQTGALTQIKATLNQPVSGIISNLYLVEATSLTTPTVDDIVTGTVSGTTVTFTITGTDQDLTALTTRYFYIAGTVTNSVNSSTQNITITVAPSDITIANCDITGSAQSSPTISFTGQNVSVNVNNTPLSKPVMQGSNDQVIFGFTLIPPAGTPSITINSIKLKANLSDGATTSHFTQFELGLDANQDGVFDGTAFAGPVNMNSGGYINFTGLTQTFTDKLYVLVRCDVAASATIGGKIQLVIESSADITLSSPALVASGGPYDGGTFTVSDPAAVPTKLVVTNFGLVSILTNDLPEKKDREVIDGTGAPNYNIYMVVQAQDANGNPANVTTTTNLSVSVTSGTATATYSGTPSITSGSNTYVFDNSVGFELNNSLGYGPITITVTPTSGMTSLTPATYTNIVVYAQQPAAGITAFSAAVATPTSATITVNATNAIQYVVVAKEGSWPTAPTDGVVYDQVPGNNFSSTSGSGNYFTGTGSVVVIKSTGTGAAQTFTITGLTSGKKYYFALYQFNGGATPNSKPNYQLIYLTNNNKTSVDIPAISPTVATSAVTFGQVTANSIKVEWTNGNGEKRIVIARAGAAPTGTPTDGSVYTANSAYGDPTTALGDGFVVYNGNANTVTVTNLLPGTTYHFAVFEYNGNGVYTNYIATSATGNRATLAAQPTIQAHSIDIQPVSNTSLKVTWVNGNGSGRVLLGKVDSPISNADFPLDQGNTLTSSATFGTTGSESGDAYVLFQTGDTYPVTVTGLEFGKTYYFRVFEYNGTAGGYTSSTVNYLTSTATNNPNYGVADQYEPANNTMATAQYIANLNGTLYDGIISNASDVDWFQIEPNVEDGYKYLRIKLTNQPKNYTIELYNKNGRLLRNSKFKGTTDEVIVINNLPIGVYYIKVYSEDGDFSITPYKVSGLESLLEYKSETP